MIKKNMIMNCLVTIEDIMRAEKINGPSVQALKVKIICTKPSPVVSDYVAVPHEIFEENRNVALSIDVMFMNRISFLTSISRHLKFTTAETLHNCTTSQLVQCVTNVKAIYTKIGFNVIAALMEGEFIPMSTSLLEMGVSLNTASASEHVLEIERQHRVIKEQARACFHSLPFKMIPKIMIIEMIYNCVLWINAFPPTGGVSSSVSPRTFLTGVRFDYNCHCKLAFGACAQVHEETFPTNSQQSRTLGDICIGPSGNLQGGYKFMNLQRGKKLTRRR